MLTPREDCRPLTWRCLPGRSFKTRGVNLELRPFTCEWLIWHQIKIVPHKWGPSWSFRKEWEVDRREWREEVYSKDLKGHWIGITSCMRSKSQLSPIISQLCQVLTPWVGNKYLQKLETKSVWNGFDWFSSDLILEPNQQPIFNGCSVKKPSFMYVKIIQLISNPSFQFVDVWGSRMYVIDIQHDC